MNKRNKTEKEEQLLIRWVNGHFTSNKDTPIASLTEFDNGEKLLRFLLEIFGATPAAKAILPTLPPPSTSGASSSSSSSGGRVASTQKFQNLEMLQRALALATSVGVNFRFISAEDFIEHNIKMILSFITSSIVKFNALKLTCDPNTTASMRATGPRTPRGGMKPKDFYDGVLAGINKIIGRAPYDLHINDFSTKNWCDGLGFLALIHSCCPDAFAWGAYSGAPGEVAPDNLSAAFDYAKDRLDLFPLLVTEDFAAASTDAGADDQGVMMYLSELYTIVLQHLPPEVLAEVNNTSETTAAPPSPQQPQTPPQTLQTTTATVVQAQAQAAAPPPPEQPPVQKHSDEEYEQLMKELEASKSKVSDLEGKLKDGEDEKKRIEED